MNARRAIAVSIAVVLVAAQLPLLPIARAYANEPAAGPATMAEAQRRFRRGAELYKEGDLDAALVEFRRAYDLVPSFKILYNLGQVSYQRRDYARALRYFRQYLDGGGAAVPADRRREVNDEIVRLEQRVSHLEVQAADAGLEVTVDGEAVGATPLSGPLTVNQGLRKVEVTAPGGERRSRVVEVAGAELARVSFPRLLAAAPPPAQLQPSLIAAAPAHETAAETAHARSGSTIPWGSWVTTVVLAGGAATAGALAMSRQRDLDQRLNEYPADLSAIDRSRRDARILAGVTDGLLVGAVVMAAVSVYLTVRRSSAAAR